MASPYRVPTPIVHQCRGVRVPIGGKHPGMTDTQPRAADVGSAGGANPSDLAEELAHLRVDVDDDGEPILLREDGSVVDTWRQGYPYQKRMRRDEYDRPSASCKSSC